MQILNARPPHFDEHDLEVLEVLCTQAASAIEHARLMQETRKAQMVNLAGDIAHDIKNMLTPIQSGLWTLGPLLEEAFSDLDALREQCPASSPLSDNIEKAIATARDFHREIIEGALSSCDLIQSHTRDLANAIKGATTASTAMGRVQPCRNCSPKVSQRIAARWPTREKGRSATP
jgi:signal transduction histidine kinase